MRTASHIAAAVVAAALTAPALATETAEPTDLAADPNQPEVKNPAPAIALRGSGRAEAAALNADPTQPRTERAAPAVALPGPGEEALAGTIINDEPGASAVWGAAMSRVVSK